VADTVQKNLLKEANMPATKMKKSGPSKKKAGVPKRSTGNLAELEKVKKRLSRIENIVLGSPKKGEDPLSRQIYHLSEALKLLINLLARYMAKEFNVIDTSLGAQRNAIIALGNHFGLGLPELQEFKSDTKDSIARVLEEGLKPVPWQVGNPR
jgi:hypothetical protein